MASRSILAVIALALAPLYALAATAAVREQTGTFAAYGLRARIVSKLQRVGDNALDLVQLSMRDGKPVTSYFSVAGAPVHVLLVRDDFRTFSHLHPHVLPNGHFTVSVALDADHRYYAFVDSFVGRGIGEQAFRFTLQNGSPPHHIDTTLAKPDNTSGAGPYEIALSTARFRANTPVTLSATVTRNGRLVTPPKFRSFKTVASVINTGSLKYVGLYEGTAMGMWYPGEYDRPQLPLPALPRGTYRMWLQISVKNVRFTAPFTLVAQ